MFVAAVVCLTRCWVAMPRAAKAGSNEAAAAGRIGAAAMDARSATVRSKLAMVGGNGGREAETSNPLLLLLAAAALPHGDPPRDRKTGKARGLAGSEGLEEMEASHTSGINAWSRSGSTVWYSSDSFNGIPSFENGSHLRRKLRNTLVENSRNTNHQKYLF
jgi:hypothetical protein